MLEILIQKHLKGAGGDFKLEVNLRLQPRQTYALMGASGVGKSTLLRTLAGLETPDIGRIVFNNQVWCDIQKRINLSPQERKVGFVFQDYGLFPHLNTLQNIVFSAPKHPKIDEIIALMELEGLLKRPISTLSGGQQQRVALARAILRVLDGGSLLCLDEGLSALDPCMRSKLQEQIKFLSAHFNLTTLLITHDLFETYQMASTLIFFQQNTQTTTAHIQNLRPKQALHAKVLKSQNQELTLALEPQMVRMPYDKEFKEGVCVVLEPKNLQIKQINLLESPL
ncbi:ATP-binding cassette domain-containing protein [Helicobacter heilmannii]|uniref:Molybdenum transport ATP-binding protein ModC (TC 3.A.1.8.1) n=1 Tax=Helicobacter heilmannii TaxID=35817 RepID=A0A0K2YDL4_HELHE|nr:ATP-binding cassette domain-containing protein [Helicobacter heilmannii]CCM11594.1 ABC transporter [Helicobacter heilmannii ASB1.4]CRF46253.1 ABC transporter [Helicobacter heilmannii]CRF47189.1 ABC transporter [Helicobacter heilmannii]CRF49475.1 ABC transporter [Helicobacter heilmannii]CRF50212.1 ABC transporter [Helicobacter heilmannii]